MWAWHFRSPFHFSGCQFCCPSHSSSSYSSEKSGHFLLQLLVTVDCSTQCLKITEKSLVIIQFLRKTRLCGVIFKDRALVTLAAFFWCFHPWSKAFSCLKKVVHFISNWFETWVSKLQKTISSLLLTHIFLSLEQSPSKQQQQADLKGESYHRHLCLLNFFAIIVISEVLEAAFLKCMGHLEIVEQWPLKFYNAEFSSLIF